MIGNVTKLPTFMKRNATHEPECSHGEHSGYFCEKNSLKSVVNFQTINSPVAGDVGDYDVVRARDVEDVRNWGGDVFKRSLWYTVKSRETVHAHNILSQN